MCAAFQAKTGRRELPSHRRFLNRRTALKLPNVPIIPATLIMSTIIILTTIPILTSCNPALFKTLQTTSGIELRSFQIKNRAIGVECDSRQRPLKTGRSGAGGSHGAERCNAAGSCASHTPEVHRPSRQVETGEVRRIFFRDRVTVGLIPRPNSSSARRNSCKLCERPLVEIDQNVNRFPDRNRRGAPIRTGRRNEPALGDRTAPAIQRTRQRRCSWPSMNSEKHGTVASGGITVALGRVSAATKRRLACCSRRIAG